MQTRATGQAGVVEAVADAAVIADADATITDAGVSEEVDATAVAETTAAEAAVSEAVDGTDNAEPTPPQLPRIDAETAAPQDVGPELAADAVPAPMLRTERPHEREDEVPAEEPKPILLWRQVRFEGRQGLRRGNHRDRGTPRGRHQGAAGDKETRTDGKGGQRDGGKERFERKFQGKEGKPDGQGFRQERRDGGKPGQKAGFQGGKPQFQQKPREERPVRVDPDSPFAKLAALRDQLKK